MSRDCLLDCQRAMDAQEEHDASERAALVAVSLISTARVKLKLDKQYTEYSAQYLVDNAGKKESKPSNFTVQECLKYVVEMDSPRPEAEQREMNEPRSSLTVKDCLECAFKDGIPREEHWMHMGCVNKLPPYAPMIPRVPMKGKVIEAKTVEDAFKLLMHQTVGAKLHVFSPEIDLVGEHGVYKGPKKSRPTQYVGLRDVVITEVLEKTKRDTFVKVQICYKKKTSSIKVSATRIFTSLPLGGEESKLIEPTGLLVDFIIPRFKW